MLATLSGARHTTRRAALLCSPGAPRPSPRPGYRIAAARIVPPAWEHIVHTEHYIIRNAKEFGHKALNNKKFMPRVRII